MMTEKKEANSVTPESVLEYFDHNGPAAYIAVGRRSTAAYVREKWDGHSGYNSRAVVWDDGVAVVVDDVRGIERLEREVPEHWIAWVHQ